MDSRSTGDSNNRAGSADVFPVPESHVQVAIETARQLAARQGSGVVLVVHLSAEERVPAGHPIRAVRRLTDDLLREMSREFDAHYVKVGRPAIPAERLARAHLLQILYSIPNDDLLTEQLHYNLLFRWFVGFDADEAVWTPDEFTGCHARVAGQPVMQALVRRLFNRIGTVTQDERFTISKTFLDELTG